MGKCKIGYTINEDGTIPERCHVDWDDSFYPTLCEECPHYNYEYDLINQAIDLLADSARDDQIARDAIANLSVVLFDLK